MRYFIRLGPEWNGRLNIKYGYWTHEYLEIYGESNYRCSVKRYITYYSSGDVIAGCFESDRNSQDMRELTIELTKDKFDTAYLLAKGSVT